MLVLHAAAPVKRQDEWLAAGDPLSLRLLLYIDLLAITSFLLRADTPTKLDWSIFLFSPFIFYSLHWIFDLAIRLMYGRYFIVTKWGSANGYRYNAVDVILSWLGIFASTTLPIFWLEPLLRNH